MVGVLFVCGVDADLARVSPAITVSVPLVLFVGDEQDAIVSAAPIINSMFFIMIERMCRDKVCAGQFNHKVHKG